MAQHKALGRGLSALFNQTSKTAPSNPPANSDGAVAVAVAPNEVKEISVENIKPNRHQPRTTFDPVALEELSESIKTHGLAQPLLVTESATPGQYELVAGERRLRASKLAGLTSVPCVIKKMSNRERFEVALIENIQRQDLNAYEEAVALDGLMKEFDLTQEQVAEAIGKSRSAVANVLRLLRLHENILGALRGGTLSEGHAKVLAGVTEHSEQLRLLDEIVNKKLSVRDLEAILSGTKAKKKAQTIPIGTQGTENPEVRKFEEDFQRILGRRVEIQTNGKKGWIKFAFYSPWDLELLCKKLGLLEGPIGDPPTE